MRRLSEEKRAHLSATSNHHWWRCNELSKWLGCPPGEVNKHWSCCISSVGITGEVESPGPNEIAESAANGNDTAILLVREAYLVCLTRKVQHEQELLEHRSKQLTAVRRSQPDPQYPTMEAQKKIMLWAIRTCGSEESAIRALKLAIEHRRSGSEY